jgi:hypothetical protein
MTFGRALQMASPAAGPDVLSRYVEPGSTIWNRPPTTPAVAPPGVGWDA